MSQHAFDFTQLDAELYLAKRLAQHGQKVFLGDTDRETRIKRFRTCIIEAGLDMCIVGRNRDSKKTETYAQVFERIFGETLVPKATRKAAANPCIKPRRVT